MFLKIERFGENNFFKEKNFTIVTFPLTGLDLTEFLPAGSSSAKYDLIGNVIHMGTAQTGSYKVQKMHQVSKEWFEIQDLLVDKILPEQVSVSESYLLLYKKTNWLINFDFVN